MLKIKRIHIHEKGDVRRFIQLPFDLYQDHPLWVPPILMDAAEQLNPEKHPFYEHSAADFFLAVRDGKDVGRIAVLDNTRYNQYHGKAAAQFYLFECVQDLEVAAALFDAAGAWARSRDLTHMLGPKGFGALDGMGMLVEGFEHRPAMTMMNYNPPFYPQFMETMGFQKEVDFVSCYLGHDRFQLPARVHRIAERVAERGSFRILRFEKKRELRKWAPEIGRAYNQAFVHNWEYYPLTEAEIKFVTDNALGFADPKLIKVILHADQVVGFLFCFADVSAAIRRRRGRLFPFGIFDLLLESKRTPWVTINGAGILPEFQGLGGNAILYSEIEKTIRQAGFLHADLTQVAESAVQMRRDLVNVGGIPYKNHRVFSREI